MNQRKAGIILSYFAQGVQIITGLIYTPIMLRLLGQSEYGLYQLVFSVVSYLGLLSFGFSSSYVRFYSRIKNRVKNESSPELGRLNGMYMTVFIIISLICIICGYIMMQNMTKIFGEGLTVGEYKTAKILMGFMVINVALTFPNSLFDSITSTYEKFFFQKLIIVLQNILNPFLTLPLLIMGYGSVGMVIITTILTVLKLILNGYFCIKKLSVRFIFNDFNYRLLKDIWLFTSFIFINMIVDQINWSVDKYLLGRMMGTLAVAIYGVSAQINAMYMQLSVAVSNVFIPEVNKMVAETNDNIKLTHLFTKVGRMQFLILFPILLGFIFYGERFIKLWAGENYGNSYYIALLLMSPVTIPLIQNIGIEIQRAKNMHQVRSISYVFIAFINIVISMPLILYYGAIGAAIGTAITMFLGNGVFMNWYNHKKVGINMIYFWREILNLLPIFILPTIVGGISKIFDKQMNLFAYMISGLLFIMVYIISLWLFGLNSEEKQSLRLRFRKKGR